MNAANRTIDNNNNNNNNKKKTNRIIIMIIIKRILCRGLRNTTKRQIRRIIKTGKQSRICRKEHEDDEAGEK